MFTIQHYTVPIRVVEEPNLQDLLADPTTHLVMQSDGVREEELTDLLASVRERLTAPSRDQSKE